MCGIVGFAAVESRFDKDALLAACNLLRHRGPDDSGVWWSDDHRVGLGHRRLSIIDLSPSGAQPIHDGEADLHLAFNGEIYNYRELRTELEADGFRFRGTSDTEVLLAGFRRWGEACLKRLVGMFALALFDARERTLFLARDRVGEKPLFYRHGRGHLDFASELKALLLDPRAPRQLDADALDEYLAYGYVSGERCILAGYRKLPPAHFLRYELDNDRLTVGRYWEVPALEPGLHADPEELADELSELLHAAIRKQIVADVPVGVLLSGGVDSSLVAAVAAQVASEPLRTFTITFPGHAKHDEGPYARLVASHFGTRHEELEAEPATVELLPELARQYDEPIADSSMVPTYLVSRLVRQRAAVVLGGDGGDELFGGYPHYSWLQSQERFRRYVPAFVRRGVGSLSHSLPLGARGRNYLISAGHGLAGSLAYVNLYFDARSRERLMAPVFRGQRRSHPEAARTAFFGPGATAVSAASRMDFHLYLAEDILVKVDRASMLTSLEVRAPFLDHRLVEFAFGRVPDHLKATESERKIIPRLLARRLLPPELDLTRKQGFSLPLADWFRGPWGRYLEHVLGQIPPELFAPGVVRGLLAGQRRGFSNTQRLYSLVIFELWRQTYDIELPARPAAIAAA